MSTPQGPGQGSDEQPAGRDAAHVAGGAADNEATTVYRPQDHLGAGSAAPGQPGDRGSSAPPTTAEPAYGRQSWPQSAQQSWAAGQQAAPQQSWQPDQQSPAQQPWSGAPDGGASAWAPGGSDRSGGAWSQPGEQYGGPGGYGHPSGGWDRGSAGAGQQYGQGGYPSGPDHQGGYGSGAQGQPGTYAQPNGYGQSAGYAQSGGYGGGYEQSSGYGQQPSWGAPGGAPSAPPKKSNGLLIGIVALVVVLALAAVALFVWPRPLKGVGPFKNDVFDAQQMNRDVAQVLSNAAPAGYGLSGVSNVNCPSGQEVVVDRTFTCSLQLDGRQTELTIKVLSGSGEYQVNPPN